MHHFLKATAGAAVAGIAPHCRYDRAIFVISHMRGATTALSNVLCSHPQLSGYGEAHIRYHGRASLGLLALNQARRRVWRPQARCLFDKLLHNRLDAQLPEEFFSARAVFLLRAPELVIPSVANLFRHVGNGEYPDETSAAQYYLSRVQRLSGLWPRFAPQRRIGMASEALLADPEAGLRRIQGMLNLDPPLRNSYQSRTASTRSGAGDPLQSGKFSSIQQRPPSGPAPDPHIAPELLEACRSAHAALLAAFEQG